MSEMSVIKCSFYKVKAQKPYIDWCVFYARNEETGDLFQAKGDLAPAYRTEGLQLQLQGRFKISFDFGRQFNFRSFQLRRASGKYGVIAFLQSSPGIGPVTAERIWDKFGEDSITELANDAKSALGQIEMFRAFAPHKIEEIQDFMSAADAMSLYGIPLVSLFGNIGFPKDLHKQVIERIRNDPVGKVSKNPFILLRFPGVGYFKCDQLRQKLKLPTNMPERRIAAINHFFKTKNNGNVWILDRDVVAGIRNLLQEKDVEWFHDEMAGYTEHLCFRDGYWATEHDAKVERQVAEELMRIRTEGGMWSIELPDTLSAHQREQLGLSIEDGAQIILLGTAGSGKTTTAAGLLGQFAPNEIVACAPTGKAAQRIESVMREKGVRVRASTCHRALECKMVGQEFEFTLDRFNCKILVIDEIGMMTNDLALEVLKRVKKGTLVMMVGDPSQLPPVGRGTLLRDWQRFCDRSGLGTYGMLSEVHRNQGDIIKFANKVSRGERVTKLLEGSFSSEVWDNPDRNFKYVRSPHPRYTQECVKELIGAILNGDIVSPTGDYWSGEDIQVVVAVNSGSPSGRDAMNEELRPLFNARGDDTRHKYFWKHDKVMCLKNSRLSPVGNCKEEDRLLVANGDMGHVVSSEKAFITVQMNSHPDTVITVPTGEDGKGDFELAYACTCHKMQGDQAPVVIVVADNNFGSMRVTSRQWLYTAVTRGKEMCVLVGDKMAINQMIDKDATMDRKSFMVEHLEEIGWSLQKSSLIHVNKNHGSSKDLQSGSEAKTLKSQSKSSDAGSQPETTHSKDSKTSSALSASRLKTSYKLSPTGETDSKESSTGSRDLNTLL
jgi:exodeoxyribonuclease V alpha subunit